jgi:hypothetical protein
LQPEALQQTLLARLADAAAREERDTRHDGSGSSSKSVSSSSSSRQMYLAAAAPGGVGGGWAPDAAVLLRRGAGTADVLHGYCTALMLAWVAQLLAKKGHGRADAWPAAAHRTLLDVPGWLAAAPADPVPAGMANSGKSGGAGSYAGLLEALFEAGWALDRAALLQGPARVAWGADLHSA